jgi:hypothetical protein
VVQRLDTGFDLFVAAERGEVHAAVAGKPLVADIDDDGFEDVAILGDTGDVHILWNDGSGQLSMDRYTLVATPAPLPALTAFRALAFVHTEDDDKLELATVSKLGIEVRALEPNSRTFTGGVSITGAPGGDLLVAGDVDGNGVVDLVVADSLGFTFLIAQAVLP